MKRKNHWIILLFFLAAAFCVPAASRALADGAETPVPAFGDRVFFGHYEQDGNPETAPEEIQWIVLDVRDGKALLLSEKVLASRRFNGGRGAADWETSELRNWLNTVFLDTAFTEEEKAAIPAVENDNSDSPVQPGENGVRDQGPTTDRVFLLSYSEYNTYLKGGGLGYAVTTEAAKAQGVRVQPGANYLVDSWWLRSSWNDKNAKDPDKIAASGGETLASFDFVGVRPAVWANLHSDAFAEALSETTGPAPSFTWKGYSLTPMFYYVYSSTIRVRIACDGIPLELLFNERENFQILDENGNELLRSVSVNVMENELRPMMLQGTAGFFDVVFPYEKTAYQSMRGGWLKAGEDADIIRLPRTPEENPMRCVFVTQDGLYVIYLTSKERNRWLVAPLQEVFDHADIRMCLGESVNYGQEAYSIPDLFLKNFEFSGLDLTLSSDLPLESDWDQQGALKRLSAGAFSSRTVFPSVTSLTIRLSGDGNRFPEFRSTFPNLEELILVINADENDEDFLADYQDLITNTLDSLKTLTVIGPDETALPTDPEFRYWLENQCAAAPEMTVNGREAAAALEGDGPGFYADYKELIRIFESAGSVPLAISQTFFEARMFGDRILFCITKEDPDEIKSISTNPDSVSFSSIPDGLLAGSLQEADTVVRIYPLKRVVGSYVNTATNQKYFDAYAIDTCAAVYTLRDGEWLRCANVYVFTSNPPGYDFSVNGQYRFSSMPSTNSGSFKPEKAVEAIGAILSASPGTD